MADASAAKSKRGPGGTSPAKKRVKPDQVKKQDIDKILDGTEGPLANGKRTIIVDTGGSGECGWRALAYAIAIINKPDLQQNTLKQKLSALSKTLHTKISLHLVSCRKDWEIAWALDTKRTEAMESGTVPQTVDEYCKAIRRPLRWVDGLQLASAAVQQRINIVVWTKKAGEWKRIAILKSNDEKKAPVVPFLGPGLRVRRQVMSKVVCFARKPLCLMAAMHVSSLFSRVAALCTLSFNVALMFETALIEGQSSSHGQSILAKTLQGAVRCVVWGAAVLGVGVSS